MSRRRKFQARILVQMPDGGEVDLTRDWSTSLTDAERAALEEAYAAAYRMFAAGKKEKEAP